MGSDIQLRQCIKVGIAIGLGISLFRFMLFELEFFTRLTNGTPVVYIAILIVSAIALTFFKGKYPMIRGSGCPQLKAVLQDRLEMHPTTELPLKFGSVVLLNGLGLSVGSAGPSVQIGAYIGQLFLQGKKNSAFLLISGLTAFAVLFCVPLAAVAFGIEEYRMTLKKEQILRLLVMMTVALSIRIVLFGTAPTLNLKISDFPVWQGTIFLLFMSILTGLIFKYGQLWFGKLYSWKPLVFLPFVLTYFFSRRMPEILGGGISLFAFIEAQGSSLPVETALLYLFSKVVFSVVCLSSGIPAGVFLPMYAVGGILGSFTALVSFEFFRETAMAYNTYIVLGISMLVTVVLRRPFTAALLAAELTGNYIWSPYILLMALAVEGLLKRSPDQPLNDILLEKLLDEKTEIDY